jgi:hypothetical protein
MNTNKSRLKDEEKTLSIHKEIFTDRTIGIDSPSVGRNKEDDSLFEIIFNKKKFDLKNKISNDIHSNKGNGNVESRISTLYYLLAHISKSLIESKYQALSSTGDV